MRISRLTLLCITSIAVPIGVTAQSSGSSPADTPTRDSLAINVLTRCLTAAGGGTAVAAVQDFTGSGSITYFWAGQPVTGSVTVRGLGVSLFRLDAQLPDGPRSWLVTDLQGTIKKADGTTTIIPYANAINLGSLTLPYVSIAAALGDSNFSITTAGTTTVNGRQGTVIKVQQTFSSADDPTGDLAKFNTKSYVIDSQTFAILETVDTKYSDDGRMQPIQHEVIFSNFTTVNGLSVPFSIVEKLGGQQTWSLQLNNIVFNTGLSTSAFQF